MAFAVSGREEGWGCSAAASAGSGAARGGRAAENFTRVGAMGESSKRLILKGRIRGGGPGAMQRSIANLVPFALGSVYAFTPFFGRSVSKPNTSPSVS